MIRKLLAVIFSLTLIVSCSTTGGTIGGLFPAPKFTKGTIVNDRYTSKDGDFFVAIPHKDGTYEYTYMQIKEQYSELGAYISFGPAALDQSIYRLEIGKKLSPESQDLAFEDTVNLVIDNYSKQLEIGYKSKPTLISKNKLTINGIDSYSILLTQNAQGQSLKHEVIVSNYKSLAAIFWVQSNSQSAEDVPMTAFQFAKSFEITTE